MRYSLKEGISEVHYSFDGPDPVKQVVRLGSIFHPVRNRTYDGEFFRTHPRTPITWFRSVVAPKTVTATWPAGNRLRLVLPGINTGMVDAHHDLRSAG